MAVNFENDAEFSDMVPKPRARRGIRIGELMTVVAIIAVLIAVLLPASRSARPAAYRAWCTNNLKQIALALRNYEEVYESLPPAYTVDPHGRPLHSWRTLILPFLEQHALYETIDLSKPWDDPANARANQTALSVYRCPRGAGPTNTTTYLAVTGANACLVPGKPRRLEEITDAHDLTLMLIEAGEENAIPWMAPMDADESLVLSLGPTTRFHHAGGANGCFVAGNVLFLKATTPESVRRAMISISGKDEAIAIQW